VSHDWGQFASHGELLRNFKDVGGLIHCPAEVRKDILKWLVLAYIGVQGGRTSWGNIRPVYYSDTAAPLVREIISESPQLGLVFIPLAPASINPVFVATGISQLEAVAAGYMRAVYNHHGHPAGTVGADKPRTRSAVGARGMRNTDNLFL